MANFTGPPWGVIACTEAAGNSAALSACTVISPLHGEYVVSGGTFEFNHPVWIFAVHQFGDVANLTRVTIRSTRSGGRYLYDSRENQPAETSTASAEGTTDLRGKQIKIEAGEVCTVEWTEDASTNVEPAVIIAYSLQPFPLMPRQVPHARTEGSCFDTGLAQSATTAVTWTRSTNIMGPNNSDTQHFDETASYTLCGMRSTGAATMKAAIVELAHLPAYPGIPGAVDPNVSAIPGTIWSEFFQTSGLTATGKEWNSATTATVDVAGSETPTHVFSFRKQ